MIRAYSRVSTVDQARNGFGLDAQRAAIGDEAARRGWSEMAWYCDAGESGKDLDRPAMARLLGDLRRGDVLVVAKLDRLSRSLSDFAALMETAQTQRWNVVALDMAIDLASPQGEFVASVMAAMARWERRIIGVRTAEGMAAAKARGVLPGRRSSVPADVQARLIGDHEAALTMRQIAASLNDEGLVTVTGVPWSHSSVYSALRSALMERAARKAVATP